MAKKKKYRILWNRVIIAAIVLIAVIVGIVMLISAIVGAIVNAIKGGDDSSSAKPANASVVQSSDAASLPDDESSQPGKAMLTVVIDPGHGGDDVGAPDPTETRYEKDDCLRISLLVANYLRQYEDVNVIMTRTDDSFVSLNNRCDIANNAKADLFVALHRNLYDGEAQGVEIWVNNKRPVIDTALAQNILDGLKAVGISNDRGVNYGYIGQPYSNYQVNRETDMPSCLVELGFMQDAEDNRLFDEHLDEYAKAIADAIYKTAQQAGMIEGIEATISEEPSEPAE